MKAARARLARKRRSSSPTSGNVGSAPGEAGWNREHYDPLTGMSVNSNLADYPVATHADTPQIDVTFLDMRTSNSTNSVRAGLAKSV